MNDLLHISEVYGSHYMLMSLQITLQPE